jgi:hypothetical protein
VVSAGGGDVQRSRRNGGRGNGGKGSAEERGEEDKSASFEAKGGRMVRR